MTFQSFTGFEYLLIDCANHAGHDKLTFDARIQWVKDNFHDLESLQDSADKPLLYLKAVQAIRKAQRGEVTGHMIGLDATASGLQIMGAVIGCKATANSTGLINPLVRADIYTDTTGVVNRILHDQGLTVAPPRSDIKDAQMTHFYGSRARPVAIFGEDTPELAAFFKAQHEVAPGACALREVLAEIWDRDALSHDWVLPDGFEAKCKVHYPVDMRVEVDELDHATFTHRINLPMTTNQYQEIKGEEFVPDGLSNMANTVHSIDGMVVREMNRRCNYESGDIYAALAKLEGPCNPVKGRPGAWLERYLESKFVPTNLLNQIAAGTIHVSHLPPELKEALIQRAVTLLDRPSFPIVCVHDEFKCHANYGDGLRLHYREIMAELADSDIMQDMLRQLTGRKTDTLKKYGDIGDLIRNSNYALC